MPGPSTHHKRPASTDKLAPPPPRGELRSIIGGHNIGGSSRRAQKRYMQEAQPQQVFVVEQHPKRLKIKGVPMTFIEEDAKGVIQPHNDMLVITITIANFTVRQVLVDSGSSADIIFSVAYYQLGIIESPLVSCDAELFGFAGEQVSPVGSVLLPVTMGTYPTSATTLVDFLVVNKQSSYNIIIGHSNMSALHTVSYIYHLTLKFPTPMGLRVVKGDQGVARGCYYSTLKGESCPIVEKSHKTVEDAPAEVPPIDTDFKLDS